MTSEIAYVLNEVPGIAKVAIKSRGSKSILYFDPFERVTREVDHCDVFTTLEAAFKELMSREERDIIDMEKELVVKRRAFEREKAQGAVEALTRDCT